MAGLKAVDNPMTSHLKQVSFVARVGEAGDVRVTGDFTGWSEEGIPLAKRAGGEWQATLNLAPGEYQYRLRVDGEWRDHGEAAKRVPNPFGSENSVLIVGG
jgi:1,4-alpha-glucan branching enzyme